MEISRDANTISGMLAEVVLLINEKGGLHKINRSSRDLLTRNLVGGIEEIDGFLTRPSVRGHLDPSIRSPVVDDDSSLKDLLRRLRKQVHAACILCDVAYLGPEANPDEQEAIEGVKRVLERLCLESKRIYLGQQGSATDDVGIVNLWI